MSNGPILSFSVDGHEAGDGVSLPEGGREMTMMRWGMPPPPRTGAPPTTDEERDEMFG